MRKTRIQILLFLLWIFGAFLPYNSFASINIEIKKIEILGLHAISRGTVLSYLPLEVGDQYTDQTSDKIIRDLYKTSFFKNIEVSHDQNTLKIIITENPAIKYIDILNYSKKVIDEDILGKTLKDMDLTQGEIFNQKDFNSLLKELKSLYVSKGYYGVKITPTIKPDSNNRVGIEINIEEGDPARIKSMKIAGAKAFDEQTLLDFFAIGEADSFIVNFFTERDQFSQTALDAGVEQMRSFYVNQGYLDFKVNKSDTELTDDKQNINVAIEINEGEQYKLGEIRFTGNLLDQSLSKLSGLLIISSGDVFERKNIVKSIKSITSLYADFGYAFAKVDPIPDENRKTHIIDLTINVALGKKIYINRITIEGNTRTQDDVVRREISIEEGGIYSNTKLDDSIKRIKRLGFFSNVKMDITKTKHLPDKINLHFTVVETKTGSFTLGISHANTTGVAFNAGIQEKNFLGTGNTLNANISSSSAVKEANFYFLNPYFTKDKHSISYGIFTKDVDGAELDVASYKINTQGLSLGYGVPLSEDTRIHAELRPSVSSIECGADLADEEEQCSTFTDNQTELKLSFNWSNNTLDDYSFPTSGHKNKLVFSVALPAGELQYYKFDAAHQSYYNLGSDFVFKANTVLGVAQGYGGVELPFFRRYHGGGYSSVRGFDFNSLGPQYDDIEKSKGGEVSFLAGVSVISPLTFVKDSKNMRVSAFLDTGGIFETVKNINIQDEMRASVGLAFSWLTPIGPLGIYLAHPILSKDSDHIKTFEFTIGNTF